MAVQSKSSLDNMLKSILAVGSQEQNAAYPPNIFTAQYNAVTSILISALVRAFPNSPQVVDMLYPFMVTKKIAVTNGYVQLPDDYRDLLGTPSVSLKPDGKDCSDNEVVNENQFKTANLKAGCKTRPVTIVNQSEWDLLTTSTYKFPTYENPIGCFFGNNQIKVCPYDISTVEVRYVRKENNYNYGYIIQPDDTFVFDPKTTVESEWGSNAFDRIFSMMYYLYSAYTRDNTLMEYAQLLNKSGLL